MNFALSKKYSEIDLEEVSPTDLMLIGGGSGDFGGGVTVSSVQAAAQSAASAQGANHGVIATVNSPLNNGYIPVIYCFTPTRGPTENGTATVACNTGTITVSSSGGGFWSSVSSFFGWLFGSH